MKLMLFGEDLSLTPGVPWSGSLHSLPNTTKVTLAADARSVGIAVSGPLPAGRVDFASVFDCGEDNGRITLTGVAKGAPNTAQSVSVTMRDATALLNNPVLLVQVKADGESGIVFLEELKQLARTLYHHFSLDAYYTANWLDPQEWARLAVGFGAADATIRPVSGGKREARILDELVGRSPFRIAFEQTLRLVEARCSGSGVRFVLRPETGYLSVGADALNQWDASAPHNGILFQHTLVNGHLELSMGATVDLAWVGRGRGEPAMAIHAYADENGHPPLVVAKRFPLTSRHGMRQDWNTAPNGRGWALPSLVVTGKRIKGTLRSADPARIDYRRPAGRRWLQPDGSVITASSSPREIHGLARGAWLSRRTSTAAPIACQLIVEPVEDDGKRQLYVLQKLELTAGDWGLRALLEEREATGGGDYSGAMVLRDSAPQEGGAGIVLPAIDVQPAFANFTKTGGMLAPAAAAWLDRLDCDVVAVFGELQVVTDPLRHASRFLIAAKPQAVFSLLQKPGEAVRLEELARSGPLVETKSWTYTFSGKGDVGQPEQLRQKLERRAGRAAWRERFEAFWHGDANAEPLKSLRAQLVTAERASARAQADWLARAKAVVLGGVKVPGFDETIVKRLAMFVNTATTVEDLTRWLVTPPSDDVRLLLDHLWQPANGDLVRRMVAAVFLPDSRLPADIRETLKNTLQLPDDAVDLLEETAFDGLRCPAPVGVSDAVKLMLEVWRQRPELADLRETYGQVLDQKAFRALIENAADAQRVVDILKQQFPITDLSTLSFAPPEYLLLSSLLPIKGQPIEAEANWLWNVTYQLCQLGQNSWSFYLDRDVTIVVKLSGDRELGAILREIHAGFRTEQRPNPLGIPLEDGTADKALDRFIRGLHPALREASWRGMIAINPTALLGTDELLKDLCGFESLRAEYVACDGASAPGQHLNTYARIRKVAEVGQAPKDAELSFALTRFDVAIANGRIEHGEIEFALDPKNLWGKLKEFERIHLRGSLPREPAGQGSGEARSFEFAAWLAKPYEQEIDIAFVDRVRFRSLKVMRYKGQTAIDIDGSLLLKSCSIGSITFDIGQEFPSFDLKNLRILLPSLPPGESIPMGWPRGLGIEFPDVSFAIKKPKLLNLFGGIELKPLRIGFQRNPSSPGDFLSLDGSFPSIRGFDFPSIVFEVSFGKLPQFGGTNLSSLKFDLLAGFIVRPGKGLEHYLALSGLSGADIRIDLFRFIQLAIKRLALRRYTGRLPNHDDQTVTAVTAEDIRFSVLDKPILPDGARFDMLLAQATGGPPKDRAVLGWLQSPKAGSFLDIHWILLAHNIKVADNVLNHLLDTRPQGPTKPDDLLDDLVDHAATTMKAQVSGDESWLVGASFALGKLLSRCSLIIHDQHYYGITLASDQPWLQTLIGSDRLILAYIPGASPDQDRFRTSFRIPAMDLLGPMRSGDFAVELGLNKDFLIDCGYPWRSGALYQWHRSFSMPMGTYEAKFGFFFEKRTSAEPGGDQSLTLAAGVGFYVGYRFGFGQPGRLVWVEAGIGVFAVLEGHLTFRFSGGITNFKGGLERLEVLGVVGIYAYGEGGIEIWVISARFRVSAQAAVAARLVYVAGGEAVLTYAASLGADYAASVRIGSGFFSFEFSVSGRVEIAVSGQLLLS